MASPYSNGFAPGRNRFQEESFLDRLLSLLKSLATSLLLLLRGRGPKLLMGLALGTARQVRRNLTRRRLLSLPHLFVVIWMLVLLRGERWIFNWKVDHCDWDHWEKWPHGATPHHLIFIADPQIIDPHSYPGRPWPLNALTVLVTDNYLRRGYGALQSQLRPDSLFFLGDLFDGGREWKTAHGDFADPAWARPHPKNEAGYVASWNRRYGEDFWLREYQRFSDIYFKHYGDGNKAMVLDTGKGAAGSSGGGQRGRKLVASLPGNHDLGFGSMVKVAVRDRFSTYFGEPNRVDVVGNHTIVSVDTVSLAADTSDQFGKADLEPIYGPAREFLKGAQAAKRRAVERELGYLRGEMAVSARFDHSVEDAAAIHAGDDGVVPADTSSKNRDVADFPTILLTHVPLYRRPGTPCGPLRERWPPSKKPVHNSRGEVEDHRNAISVAYGYQYQNVLGPEDSSRLVEEVGNVRHVFSGDDHDYCEVRHDEARGRVREITVKSISMAMGVPTPGFLMVSLWNPVSPEDGKPLSPQEGAPGPDATIQTHLCLLPTQFNTYFGYIYLGLVCVAVLTARAFLVPLLGLEPFRLPPDTGAAGRSSVSSSSSGLPLHKHKLEDREGSSFHPSHGSVGSGSSHALPPRTSSLLGSRGRASSTVSATAGNGSAAATLTQSSSTQGGSSGGGGVRGKRKNSKGRGQGRWGWAETGGPRIQLRTDFYYDDGGSTRLWRAASGGASKRVRLGAVGREFAASMWRVVWMAGLFWVYLNYKG